MVLGYFLEKEGKFVLNKPLSKTNFGIRKDYLLIEEDLRELDTLAQMFREGNLVKLDCFQLFIEKFKEVLS